MGVRVVLVIFVLGILGAASLMSMNGVWGESSSVQSTRAGSPGGGYRVGGGVK